MLVKLIVSTCSGYACRSTCTRFSKRPRAVDLDALQGLTILTHPARVTDLDLQGMADAALTDACHTDAPGRDAVLALHPVMQGVVHALLVWWDMHLDRHTGCTSGPRDKDTPGALSLGNDAPLQHGNTVHRIGSWRPLLVSLPQGVRLEAGTPARVRVVVDEHGLRGEPVGAGEPVARPMWAAEADDVHVQRARYCDLLVRRVCSRCCSCNTERQDGELIMRCRGRQQGSVGRVLRQLLQQCGALRLHPAVVRRQLQRLTALELLAAQGDGDDMEGMSDVD